jgi:YfiH family protein
MHVITPAWTAQKHVKALTTTRLDGISTGAYASLNLGDHVGDDPAAVRANRAALRGALELPSEPLGLRQVHGTHIVDAAIASVGTTADGAWTNRRGIVLAIMTADCLPIFLADRNATKIALVHAGWRGLAAGVVEAGVRALSVSPEDVIAHLGPGIGPDAYEVGDDVRDTFVASDTGTEFAFRAAGPGKWFADMYALARKRLNRLGLQTVTGGDRCTLREADLFYSYRRDRITGRIASLLWLE